MYDPICLGLNIEKHAAAPLYPQHQKHPDIDYINYDNLKIDKLAPYLQKLEHDIKMRADYDKNKHWLDYVHVSDIPCQCDKGKVAFEKIFNLNDICEKNCMMYNNCRHALFAAAKRQMKMAPKPDPEIAHDFVKFAKQYLEKYVGEDLTHFGYSYQQWYEHNNAAKQHDIDEYWDALENPHNYRTEQLKKITQSTIYEGICKQELQDTSGKPRMVCAIPIKTKVTMGPITWKLEELFQEKLPGYCGGKNLEEMQAEINNIIKMGFTKIVEGDGSGFDNTQDVSLKEVDRYIYQRVANSVYHVPKQQFLDISQQLTKTMDVIYINNGKRERMMRYTILGSVFSGDCDTTLANTTRMALYNIYVNEKAGLQLFKDYIVWSKGDDFTVFYKPYVSDSKIKETYYKYFLKELPTEYTIFGLGQVLKFITIGNPSSISFCSLKAWFTTLAEDEIILTRNPIKFLDLNQYSRKIKKFKGPARIAFLKQQAISLRVSYTGIQIFEYMAEMFDYAAWMYAKDQKEYARAEQLLRRRMGKMRNRLAEKHKMYESKLQQMMNNIQYKTKNAEKMHKDGYWEGVKQRQLDCMVTAKLDPVKLAIVNQNINEAINIEQFRSSMGHTKLIHETYQKFIKQYNQQ